MDAIRIISRLEERSMKKNEFLTMNHEKTSFYNTRVKEDEEEQNPEAGSTAR